MKYFIAYIVVVQIFTYNLCFPISLLQYLYPFSCLTAKVIESDGSPQFRTWQTEELCFFFHGIQKEEKNIFFILRNTYTLCPLSLIACQYGT